MAESLAASAGANSIFVGDTLLTTPNPQRDVDDRPPRDLGLLGSAHGQSPSQKNG